MPAQNAAADVLRDVSNLSGGDDSIERPVDETEPGAENIDPEKLKITYDFYKRVSNMLVLFLRGEQEAHQEESEWSGIKCSELANWWVY